MASAGARRSRLKPCLCRLSIRLAILPSLYAACFPLLSFHVIGWVLEIRFMAAPEGYISGWLFAKRFCPLRSEEHTSELQSRLHLVCRLLLEQKTHNTTQ